MMSATRKSGRENIITPKKRTFFDVSVFFVKKLQYEYQIPLRIWYCYYRGKENANGGCGKFMKRLTAIILVVLLSAAISGCKQADTPQNGKIDIICTIFPQYDWVRQILGDRINDISLTLLANNRIDLHNYQPSVEDILKISNCDLFIYVGGESDQWIEDVLGQAKNKNMTVINLLDILGTSAKEEELIEGMEDDGDDDDETAYDEHVWLSLKNARKFCAAIESALCFLDSENADKYKNNLSAYDEKLSVLDIQYKAAADAAPLKTLLFGDRFPFRYLTEDYNLDYYAAFPGCSAETEASFDTIIFLANKMDELNLRAVMVTESADQSIAKTIINNTADRNRQILVLDAMQSVTSEDIKNETTYLSIMENNLSVLKEALR